MWVSETVKGQSGGPSDKQKSNTGSWFGPSTCSTCSAWYGSLGNEPEPDLFIKHLVMIFREVRRVLRPDGTLWVNIGDTYAANRGYQVASTKGYRRETADRRRIGLCYTVKTKIELTLDIVDWEHRYKHDRLQGGQWCLQRIRELMKLSHRKLSDMWKCQFE